MLDSEEVEKPSRNRLYRLCAVGGVLVGTFLAMGAYGHFEAVRAAVPAEVGGRRFALLAPAMILAGTGLIDIVLCKLQWDGNRAALKIVVTANLLALVYLLYLLWTGVPGHPIALFTAIVSCYVVLLAVTLFGPAWPATEQGRPN